MQASVYMIGAKGLKPVTTSGLKKGMVVSYGDMANSRQKAVITSDEIGHYGLPIIFLEDLHRSQVTMNQIQGPGGWRLEDETMTDAEIEAIIEQCNQKIIKQALERTNKQQQQKELEERGKLRFEQEKPEWAKAVIVAIEEIDESDSMTDYCGTRDGKTYLLAWSKHTRDLFPELRKAALNCDETKHLFDAPESAEHREKYSMGSGYYLKNSCHYSTGWRVEKMPLHEFYLNKIYEIMGTEDGYKVPVDNNIMEVKAVTNEGELG